MSEKSDSPKKRRLYYFTSFKWAVSNIEKKRLKISRLLDLNDPFELRQVKTAKDGYQLRKQLDKYISKLNQEKGLLCFSRRFSNPLMWGHYADRGRGVALAFDVHSDLQLKVDYPKEFLEIPTKVTKDFVLKFLSTKARDWRYEKEVRMMKNLDTSSCEFDAATEAFHFFEPFTDQMKLRAIFLGPNIDKDQVSVPAIKQLLNDPDVRIFQTELASNKFKVIKIK
jgi:hypothetical protein